MKPAVHVSPADPAPGHDGSGDVDGTVRAVRVGSVDLSVLTAGDGPAVLLLHGFPDSRDVWREQVPALVRAGYRVVAPDLRGCGASSIPARVADFTLDHLVADVVGVLDALDIARASIVAHDWGAVIAWQVCLRHPERVSRYVALSVGHPLAYARPSAEQALKAWYVLFFQLRGLAEVALRARDWWLFRRITRFEAETPAWIASLARPGRLAAAINLYRANLRTLLTGKFPPVRVPVFGIWSSEDRYLSESQMIRSAGLVDAPWRYERIDGANHWLQLTAPARVNELLLEYLATKLGAR